MINIKVEKLKPKNSKKENLYVLMTIVIIIVVSLISLSFRVKTITNVIDDRYISSNKISASDNITFTNLNNICADLPSIIDGENTVDMKYLSSLYYEPFVPDTLDSHKWHEFISKDKTFFVGLSDDDKHSDFILEIDVNSRKGIIRLTKKFESFNKDMKISDLEDKIKHFKIIKTYTGKEFMKGQ